MKATISDMPRIRAGSIEEHRTLVRAEILEAASALFRAQGYTDTHLSDISGYVGIGRTTLYEYFSDKEDILISLVEETIPEVLAELLDDLPDDLTNRERLAELIVRGLRFVSTDEHLGSVLMRETPRLSASAQRKVRAAHARLSDEVVDVCRRGIDSGEFRAYDPVMAGRLVYSLMMASSETLRRSPDAKQEFHEAADELVRFVFDGLGA